MHQLNLKYCFSHFGDRFNFGCNLKKFKSIERLIREHFAVGSTTGWKLNTIINKVLELILTWIALRFSILRRKKDGRFSDILFPCQKCNEHLSSWRKYNILKLHPPHKESIRHYSHFTLLTQSTFTVSSKELKPSFLINSFLTSVTADVEVGTRG